MKLITMIDERREFTEEDWEDVKHMLHVGQVRAEEISVYRRESDIMRDALTAVVEFVEYVMASGERPCPLCGHHYIHTDYDNRKDGDRIHERHVCPYPLAKRALKQPPPKPTRCARCWRGTGRAEKSGGRWLVES